MCQKKNLTYYLSTAYRKICCKAWVKVSSLKYENYMFYYKIIKIIKVLYSAQKRSKMFEMFVTLKFHPF